MSDNVVVTRPDIPGMNSREFDAWLHAWHAEHNRSGSAGTADSKVRVVADEEDIRHIPVIGKLRSKERVS